MKRNIVLLAAIIVGVLLVGGVGREEPAAAQAQTPERQDAAQARGAAGGSGERGVVTRPGEDGRRAASEQVREATPPPPGLTEEGRAALEQARQGNAQPAGRPTIDAGAPSSGPSANGPENNAPQPDAPAFGTSFLGVADTGSFPPDSQIAAGPNNIVASTNGAVNILDKRGNSLSSQTLAGFFSALGPEHNDVFDPWVVYDPYLNRFWILAVSGRTTQFSNIVIGLSETQDATLGWRLWELDATFDGGTDTSNWCDYPKLGFDSQAIYVTCNMFQLDTTVTPNVNRFQYTKTRIMTKTQFVNNTGIFWWDTTQLREGNVGTGSFVFTLQPAQMFGASNADGEFLVDSQGGGGTGNTLDVWRITNAAECCDQDTVGPTLAYQSHGVGSYGPSDGARQPGSTTQINNGDSRLLYAFWKNGRLSTGHTVACSGTPTNACGGFTELNVAGYPTISTLRNYALSAGGQDVYYPSMSVNGADDRTMVFTVSDGSLSPTAAYVGVPSFADCTASNPTCLDGGTTAFQFGQNSNGYVRLDTRSRNRWGDYSGASPDPNGEGIWVAGEFAAATQNTWGVQAGLTYQTAPPPANDPFNGSQFVSGTSVSVNGTNRYATWQPGEPGSNGTTHSVWYRWTAPFSGPVTMDTCNSSFDTILAVYTGGSVGGLSQVASDDDACTSPNANGSQLTFNAVAGTTYRMSVRGFSGSEGTFTLNLKMPPQNDNFANAQNIGGTTANGNNFGATLEGGDPPTVDGRSTSHTVWYKWTAPFSGPVEVNTCTASFDTLLGVYTGSTLANLTQVAANDDGCSVQSKVTFNAVAGTTYRLLVDGFNLQEGTFTLRLIERTPPKVASTNPASNAPGVSPTANVTATFSEAMNAGTIGTATFKLKKNGTTTNVPAAVTYNATTKKATLNPNAALAPGTYTATITNGARDAAGNALDQNPNTAGNQNKTWKFTVT